MSNNIKDGTGTGRLAKVGDQNRVHTHALSASTSTVASVKGDAFNISSNLVTLTNDSEAALLYIQNNEDADISIITEFVNIGTSTGAPGVEGTTMFYLNPTGGTLISNAVEAQVLNRRIGDNETLDADTFRGVQGDTITGGNSIPIPSPGGAIASEYIIPKGASFALSYTPASGNTNIDIQIGFLVIKNYPSYTTE